MSIDTYTCKHCATTSDDEDYLDRNGYCMACQDELLEEICWPCRGSGMGYVGETRCTACNGGGEF